MTEKELQASALADYRAHQGKRLRVWVIGASFDNGGGTNDTYTLSEPAIVRVPLGDPTGEVWKDICERWQDEFLDPVWVVELAEPHPTLNAATTLWIGGHSYCITDGTRETNSEWAVIDPRD